MTIGASAVWEFRTAGSNNNSGGFDAALAGAGTDYSQQDAAQLSLTDCVAAQNSTTLTSATGGFTSAMIGNAIYFASGTNFLVQPFFITAFTDTNTVTIDRFCCTAGAGSGGVGAVGGARSLPTDAFLETLKAGNTIWYKFGTYVLTESLAVTTGVGSTAVGLVRHVGYNTTRNDDPTGASRPTITIGTYQINTGTASAWQNFIMTGSTSPVLTVGGNSHVYNCKVTCGTGQYHICLQLNSTSRAIQCEFHTSSGSLYGIGVSGSGAWLINCVASDMYMLTEYGTRLINCIADTCYIGWGTESGGIALGCTFYNCFIGINLNANTDIMVVSSIISNCTTGFSKSSSAGSYQLIKNIWNNTTNFVNTTIGDTDVIADPLLNAPATLDFTLQAGSPALATGLNPSGIVGSYNWNIGYDQGDHTAAGGGESSNTWVS